MTPMDELPDLAKIFNDALNQVRSESPKPIESLAPDIKEAAARDHDSEDRIQLHWMRYAIAGFVAILLMSELVGLYSIILWQGRGHFKLDPSVIGIVSGGVLVQTFFSFRTIVTHVFPNGSKDFKK
jgi:hypothetical protein